jgi:amidase
MDAADLAFAGAARQADLIRAGEVSPRELLDVALERIERIDPRLNSFRVVLADSAGQDAAKAERRRAAGERAPLLGVPVAVKDNVDVAGEITTHGTGAMTRVASSDSEIVRRLRSAGAVIVGKTTLPELAMWGSFTASETWGTTRNPWDPSRSPGGSSGGSAAAVAAGLAAVATGSDGGASIRVPAAMCGLFGLKPQRGRVSLMPDAEHWHGLTHFGGLARSVLDSALFLDVVAGPAAGDADTPPQPDGSFADAAGREPGRLRVAVSFKSSLPFARVAAPQRRAVEDTAELLRSLGHQVEERSIDWGQMLPDIMPRYLAGVRDDAARLDAPERLEARSRRMISFGRRISGSRLAKAREHEPRVAARIGAGLVDHDVLLMPVIAKPPPKAEATGGALRTFNDGSPYVGYTAPWNYTGQPAASVPAGFDDDGLPVAVQIVARPNDEATLLSLAAQLEAVRPWADRRPPVG